MSEAPDPNWGTVHSLARSFIKKLDLIDDLIAHLSSHGDSRDALAQLQVFRSGLLDILKEYSIESYSLEPGTVIDIAARKRIQIVETLSQGGHAGTLIVRTYRPGYVCQNGDLGIPTLLRKADVAVSMAVG
jgi:molecular chaperone GrpE (heat shock protein)